jgi:hypothetical protein
MTIDKQGQIRRDNWSENESSGISPRAIKLLIAEKLRYGQTMHQAEKQY